MYTQYTRGKLKAGQAAREFVKKLDKNKNLDLTCTIIINPVLV